MSSKQNISRMASHTEAAKEKGLYLMAYMEILIAGDLSMACGSPMGIAAPMMIRSTMTIYIWFMIPTLTTYRDAWR